VDVLDGHPHILHDGAVPVGPRSAYVHHAALAMDTGADPQAPGASVTVALCGHWEHEGPCRWPHRTWWGVGDDGLRHVRTVFVAATEEAHDVRARIDGALRDADDWTVASSGAASLEGDEVALAARLDRTGR
jgi:hypothetical protein